MPKMHLATSALNRLLNFMDELEAPIAADTVQQGAAIDAALVQPTGELPAAPGIEEALVTEGLGLAPRY